MTAQTVTCPGCGGTFNVPSILMEKGELRVRCPDCDTRFRLRWRAPAPPASPPVEPPAAPPAPAKAAVPPADPAAEALTRRRLERRARRLARALAAGRLLAEFGPEIQRAWRVYVDKVGEDFARTHPQFRDAFNEIVADGHPLF